MKSDADKQTMIDKGKEMLANAQVKQNNQPGQTCKKRDFLGAVNQSPEWSDSKGASKCRVETWSEQGGFWNLIILYLIYLIFHILLSGTLYLIYKLQIPVDVHFTHLAEVWAGEWREQNSGICDRGDLPFNPNPVWNLIEMKLVKTESNYALYMKYII